MSPSRVHGRGPAAGVGIGSRRSPPCWSPPPAAAATVNGAASASSASASGAAADSGRSSAIGDLGGDRRAAAGTVPAAPVNLAMNDWVGYTADAAVVTYVAENNWAARSTRRP